MSFNTTRSAPGDTKLWSNNVHHCVDQSICNPAPRKGLPPCLEFNTGRDSEEWQTPYYDITFDDKVARVAATLHDLFDSWQPSGGKPTANEPGNGNPWQVLKCPSLPFSPPVLYFNDAAAGPGPQDESVRLNGQKLFALVQGLEGPFLSEAGFMGAIDKLSRYEGFSWCERCRLFAASEPTEAHRLAPYTSTGPRGVCLPMGWRQHVGGAAPAVAFSSPEELAQAVEYFILQASQGQLPPPFGPGLPPLVDSILQGEVPR